MLNSAPDILNIDR